MNSNEEKEELQVQYKFTLRDTEGNEANVTIVIEENKNCWVALHNKLENLEEVEEYEKILSIYRKLYSVTLNKTTEILDFEVKT